MVFYGMSRVGFRKWIASFPVFVPVQFVTLKQHEMMSPPDGCKELQCDLQRSSIQGSFNVSE